MRQPKIKKHSNSMPNSQKDTLLCKKTKKNLPQFCRCLSAMPTKKWGKADKAALSRLIDDGDVDIYDMSTANIDRVGVAHFLHRKKKLHRNFCDFAASFAVEKEYSSTRRRRKGESSHLFDCCFRITNIFQPCHHPTAHQ